MNQHTQPTESDTMRKMATGSGALLVAVLASGALGAAVILGARGAAASAADTPTVGPKVVEESMHEFMEYVFEPAYKRLKADMAVETKDAKVWKSIKGDTLALAESGNLLFARAPKEGAADWNAHAAAARDGAAKVYAAAKQKDAAAAQSSYAAMLTSCNACHKQFAKGKHQLAP